MGAPHLPAKVEDLILETLIDLRNLLNYEPAAKQVRNALISRLKKYGYTEPDIPKLRTIQERLKVARIREKQSLGYSDVDEAQTWNMLTLNIFSLPPESIPFVLQQWRYSTNLDVNFTIRQAKWVSRLYPLFKDKDIAELWFASRRYSREEELSILSNTPMRIYQLDSQLIMGDWECYTLEFTDIHKNQLVRYIHHTVIPLAQDGYIAEEFIHSLPTVNWPFEDLPEEEFNRIVDIFGLVTELPSSITYFPDLETRMVYLRHLSYIAKMPKWNTLEPEEIRDIILQLRKLVIDLKQDIEEEKSRLIDEDSPLGDRAILSKSQWKVHEILDDIYRRAGHIDEGGEQ